MQLSHFSLSLSVSDIKASLTFYEKLGFKVIDGGHINEGFKDTEDMKWRIVENDVLKLGLFQGMFAENMLTFNPPNVHEIQEQLKLKGIKFSKEAPEASQDGYVSAMLEDPDGNKIMFDQV